MRRSREMGLAGMSHQPCRDQKTTDPEKPSFPSLPHRCSLSRRGAGETCPRQGAFQAHGGDRILAASADYYAVDPLPPVEKKRRGARSADSSSVHYRRSSVHIRRETRPKTGSTDRFREPHAPSDPGTHTTAPLSLSPSLPTSCSSLAPSCVSSKVSRASKVSVPLSCRLEAATSATRPRDPRMWAAVFAYLRHISGVGCIISVCIIAHQRYHRWNITPNGTGYCERIEFDSIFLFFFKRMIV